MTGGRLAAPGGEAAKTTQADSMTCRRLAASPHERSGPQDRRHTRRANFKEVGVDGSIRYLRNVVGLWLLQESTRLAGSSCRQSTAPRRLTGQPRTWFAAVRRNELTAALATLRALVRPSQAPSAGPLRGQVAGLRCSVHRIGTERRVRTCRPAAGLPG